MYTLYGSKGSGSAAVEVALEMCALPHRIVRAPTWEDDSARDELRSVNPMQQIPTLLLPDGTVMSESVAILMHLGIDVAAPGKLLPTDPSNRAQAIRGLVFIAANCYSAISVMDYPQRWTTEDDKESLEAIQLGTRRLLHHHWEIFADTFAKESFMNGDAPGALDILAAVVSKWGGSRAHLQEHRPAFFALLQRIGQHETVAPVFMRHWSAA
ncbi:MAG: glutathione S-transferase family protein [Ramlibacter sp.]|nr:glutathione S-transferase family protein [Ramlibacter sp.]